MVYLRCKAFFIMFSVLLFGVSFLYAFEVSNGRVGTISGHSVFVEASDDSYSDPVFEDGGNQFVLRDGETYLLGSSQKSVGIYFDPSLPSSICEGELLPVTVKGSSIASPTSGEAIGCTVINYQGTFEINFI